MPVFDVLICIYPLVVYLEAPSSKSDLLLLFKFGVSTLNPKWNITISLIPCGSDLIGNIFKLAIFLQSIQYEFHSSNKAPKDCLQYFVKGSNTVKSFNWKDTTGMRQLSKMNYKICFRNEIVNNQVKTKEHYYLKQIATRLLIFILNNPASA